MAISKNLETRKPGSQENDQMNQVAPKLNFFLVSWLPDFFS